ncbi:hypothetical protein [Arthrobacter sp. H41]|uniref:hypothetical protein n=1 Tax=Arthrobacter sp. H41 TaxID=1312978 RepID=UPI0031B8A3F5
MMPNPPTWIRARITVWPNGVQKVAVSTVINPVTQTADTAVKSAGMTISWLPGVLERGSISRAAPRSIAARNASGTSRTGLIASSLIRFFTLIAANG